MMDNTQEKYVKSLSILTYASVKNTDLEKDWLKLKAGVLFDEEVNETEKVEIQEVREEPQINEPSHPEQQNISQSSITSGIGITPGKR